MNEIQGIARLKILDGKLEEFKRLSSLCMEAVRTKDTGTIQYETYFNADQTECLVLERYRDSQALLDHFKNMGELMTTMFTTCTGSGEVCGNATPELKKALEGAPVRIFSPFQAL
jgi:quinol monooxygenase YgiN